MNTPTLNPFRPTRWEHQRTGHHLIWFTQTAEQLAEDKAAYVRGSRGSGKTTLLRSICWEDLTQNPSLQRQKSLEYFRYIGIYIRFPDYVNMSLGYSDWATIYPNAPRPELELHRYFSLALELVCIDRSLTACHELRLRSAAVYGAEAERQLVQDVVAEFPRLTDGSDHPATFLDLAQDCRQLVRVMNQACGRGTIAEVSERLPTREPGELLTYVTEKLSLLLTIRGAISEGPIGFKFCLDDCEVLNHHQQQSLNTIVRISRFPVSWVVSSVGSFFNTSDTFIEQQPLTDHDRKIFLLDSRESAEFKSLCQAVLSLRLFFATTNSIQKAYKGDLQEFFDVDARLGRRPINALFELIIKSSKSPYAQKLQDASFRLDRELTSISEKYIDRIGRLNQATYLPYYEAYILLLWQGKEDSFKVNFDDKDVGRLAGRARDFERPAFEAWLRRKQVAALLHFASRLGFRKLQYGGASTIVALADGSVRDFLEIIGEIFEAYSVRHGSPKGSAQALDHFATSRTRIGWPVQARGISRASETYLAGISNRSELDSSVVTRFVEGLGVLTALLQSSADDPTTLGRAERGIYSVRLSTYYTPVEQSRASDMQTLVWSVIRQAELAGYIRTHSVRFAAGTARYLTDDGQRVVSFRLHRRFSPYFRFSYRGAYEVVAIGLEELGNLIDRNSLPEPRIWAARIAARLIKPSESDGDQLHMEFDESSGDE